MALRGTELILFVRAQNQASYTLRRVATDVRALTHARDLHTAAEQMAIKQARLGAREQRLAAQIASRGVGGATRLALDQRSATLVEKRFAAERAIAQVETSRLRTQAQIATGQERQIRLNRQLSTALPGTERFKRLSLLSGANQQRLKAAARDMESYQVAVTTANRRIRNLDTSINKLSADYEKNEVAIRSLRTEQELLARQSAQLALAQTDVAKAMRFQRLERAQVAARAVSHVGRVATLAGLVGTAALGGAASQAATFDTQTTLAATQAANVASRGFSDVVVKSNLLRKSIYGLMQQFPATSDEMAKSAYDIYSSLNVSFGGGIRLLTAFNKVAVGGGVSLDIATQAGITAIANFGQRSKSLEDILNRMFAIVRYGRLTFGEFNTMLTKVGPAAFGAGQSLDDVAGAMAELSIVIGPEKAGTALARLLDIMQNRDLVRGLKQMGVTAQTSTGQMRPLFDVISDLVRLHPNLRSGGAQLNNLIATLTAVGRGPGNRGITATQQARRALQALIKNFDDYKRVQSTATTDNNEFARSFNAMSQSLGVRWQVFLNQLKVAVLIIGEAVIPVFIRLGRHIQKWVEWFRNLDPHTRNFYLRMAAIGSVVLLVGGLLASIVGTIVSLTLAMRLLSIQSAGVGRGLGALAAIGAIVITLELVKKGDPGLWQYASAALAGAAIGGQIGGPYGAAIGAVTLPVILEVSTHFRTRPGAGGARGGYAQYVESTLQSNGRLMSYSEWLSHNMRTTRLAARAARRNTIPEIGEDIVQAAGGGRQRLRQVHQHINTITGDFWTNLVHQMHMAGQDAQADALQKWIDKNVTQAGPAADRARQLTESVANAVQEANQQISSAAANLTNTFLQIKQTNEQQFGSLFAGPWLTGPQAQTAEQWGISPGITDLTKDLRMQVGNFQKFRADLNALQSRGAPRGLLTELQALGPDALDKIDELRKAAPAKFNQFVAVWQQKQKLIEQATKIDFNKQLKQWFSYGKGIAEQIILGLRSENVALDNAFKTYILNKFPDIVAEAKRKATEEFNKANPPAKGAPKVPAAPRTPTVQHNDNSTTNIHVHPQPGENTMDTARRAAHIFRNRARAANRMHHRD